MHPQDFWFPWYPALYADHAIHLTLEQDAIYRRMIDRYMLRREPLPSGSQAVANICMISLDKWLEHAPTILLFFNENCGLLYHKKCDIELNRQDMYSKRMSENAKKSAEKRKQKQGDTSGGSAAAAIQDKDRTRQDKIEVSNTPLPPLKNNGATDARKRRKPTTFITEDFRADIGSIPLAAKHGLDLDDEQRRFIDYWLAKGDARADWQASFRTWLGNSAKYRTEREQRKTDERPGVRDVTGALARVIALRQQRQS